MILHERLAGDGLKAGPLYGGIRMLQGKPLDMIKSFVSRWSEAIMGELYGGDIWALLPAPISKCLKADKQIEESRDPKSHGHQLWPSPKPSP